MDSGQLTTWAVLALLARELLGPAARALAGRIFGRSEASADTTIALSTKMDGVISTLAEMKSQLQAVPSQHTRISILEDWRKTVESWREHVAEEFSKRDKRHHDLANKVDARSFEDAVRSLHRAAGPGSSKEGP